MKYDWFSGHYGLFFHFLPGGKDFPAAIESFDTDKFCDECASSGAAYVVFTIGQNNGFYNAPNDVYEDLAGYAHGEKCARRDLIADIADALFARGLRLLAYHPAGLPKEDSKAALAFQAGAKDGDKTGDWTITPESALKWAQVLREYSLRYGAKLSGWWIDGCYKWSNFNENVAKLYADALKSGNSDALVAFNPGEGLIVRTTEYENYTAGEFNALTSPICGGQYAVDDCLWHELSYLGESWSSGLPKYTAQQVAQHVAHVTKNNGAITIDLPFSSGGDTVIQPEALAVMRCVAELLS